MEKKYIITSEAFTICLQNGLFFKKRHLQRLLKKNKINNYLDKTLNRYFIERESLLNYIMQYKKNKEERIKRYEKRLNRLSLDGKKNE